MSKVTLGHEPSCAYHPLPFETGSANKVCSCPGRDIAEIVYAEMRRLGKVSKFFRDGEPRWPIAKIRRLAKKDGLVIESSTMRSRDGFRNDVHVDLILREIQGGFMVQPDSTRSKR